MIVSYVFSDTPQDPILSSGLNLTVFDPIL